MKTVFNFFYERRIDATKLLLAAVLFVFVLYPFLVMVLGITSDDFVDVFNSPMFVTAIKNSVKTASIATVISVAIGFLLAMCLQRTTMRFKNAVSVFLILTMLIPSLSHGTGLIVLFGNNGFFTEIFGLESTIYGFWGIVIGTVLYSYPVAFLMFNDVLKYEDSSPYEAAQVLGIPKFRRFTAITFPYLRKPLISAVFSVFTMGFTDYGVARMVGGKTMTLAVMMYQEVIGQLNFTKGSVIGIILLLPAVAAFVLNAINKDDKKLTYVTKPFDLKKNRIRDAFAYIFCFTIIFIVCMLLSSFAAYAFATRYPRDMTFTLKHIEETFRLKGGEYLVNSLIISFATAAIGVIITFATAYMTARIPSRSSQFLHLISMTSLAIPGIVLGLAYVFVFKGTFLFGTMAILILVDLMHFFASPYLLFYNSLSKMNENLESVGFTLGIPRLKLIKDVIIPQSQATVFEVFSYFFVNSMMTISAVSFLFSYDTKPLSLMIGQFEAQMAMECAAVVSLMILSVNVTMKVIIHLLKQRAAKKDAVPASSFR